MKKLIYLVISVTTLIGCKSTKNTDCDAYGSYRIKVEHCHIDEEQYCYYSVDTIRLTN